MSLRRSWPLVIGIVLFAALMALRYELVSEWARATAAGCAFAVLALGILLAGKARS